MLEISKNGGPGDTTSAVCSDTAQGGKRGDSRTISAQPFPRQRRVSRSDDGRAPEPSTLLAAGLPSIRCTREFADRCNLLLHNRPKSSPRPPQSNTYEDANTQLVTRNRHFRYGDTVPLRLPGSGVGSEAATSLQTKLREQYARYNRFAALQPSDDSSSRDDTASKTECEANRLRSMRHCRIFFDTDNSGHDLSQTKSERLSVAEGSGVASQSVEQNDKESDSNHDSARPVQPVTTERTIIGGLRTVFPPNSEWQIVTMRMSCIDPSMTERELEDLARQADVQVVALELDRNIISHLCNGTGSITCRHTGGEPTLLRFSQLLAKRGIRLYVTDLISQPDLKRLRMSK
ncbi:uncharacterized protein BXIN_1119 [Babesia sp. Xinjiang]|uniref:uncharacterized protein n=1 Tax=Babesia sp. Xinjiang TaxID=462227 RepID=UPI000A2582FE|nr:uncharacterized protein BXIN_1119 [Babesia sp. Xinjiang]ORM42378.1 hypothetical protein BXIN_1119 [Babesia sp. Xinjiang]